MRWPRSRPAPGGIRSAHWTYASGCRRSSAGTTPRAAPPTRSQRCATGHAPGAASRAWRRASSTPWCSSIANTRAGPRNCTWTICASRSRTAGWACRPTRPCAATSRPRGCSARPHPSARARARCSRATGSSTARCAASSSIMSRRCGTWTSTTARVACSPARAPGRSPSCWASWTTARAWSATCSGTWTRARRAWSMVCPRPS